MANRIITEDDDMIYDMIWRENVLVSANEKYF